MTLVQRFALYSATALAWNSGLSVTRPPTRRPQAFHTFEADSMLMRRPVIPGTVVSSSAQTLDTGSPV